MQVTRLIPDARGTTCNQEMEPILNSSHSHILRIPFRTEKGVLRQWVSRFDIYPYLENYAKASVLEEPFTYPYVLFYLPYFELTSLNCDISRQDATTKILELMEGKPDLIIGNYTDGNLVASLLANKLGVTQVPQLIILADHLCCIIFLIINRKNLIK